MFDGMLCVCVCVFPPSRSKSVGFPPQITLNAVSLESCVLWMQTTSADKWRKPREKLNGWWDNSLKKAFGPVHSPVALLMDSYLHAATAFSNMFGLLNSVYKAKTHSFRYKKNLVPCLQILHIHIFCSIDSLVHAADTHIPLCVVCKTMNLSLLLG